MKMKTWIKEKDLAKALDLLGIHTMWSNSRKYTRVEVTTGIIVLIDDKGKHPKETEIITKKDKLNNNKQYKLFVEDSDLVYSKKNPSRIKELTIEEKERDKWSKEHYTFPFIIMNATMLITQVLLSVSPSLKIFLPIISIGCYPVLGIVNYLFCRLKENEWEIYKINHSKDWYEEK